MFRNTAATRIGKNLGKMAVCSLLAAALLVPSASAESKARIVRLSDVEGTVQLDRNAGDGFDKAFLNLPVIEGSRLKTGKDGRAEVEFEDGSALRLGPNAEVDFTRLALGDDGQKLSTIQLVSGTVYADVHPKKTYGKDKTGDQFQLNFADESVSVPDSAHFRVELDGASHATVAVFRGKLSATGPSGQFEVAEKHSATIKFAADPTGAETASTETAKNDSAKANQDTFVIAKNYDDDPSDGYDRRQTEYRDRYASAAGGPSVASPYAYGMNDLNYYGNFMTVPGYGSVWQPYFIGANWSPFQAGGWAFYPGAGYLWVSGYPWGWMPYNYGAWALAPGYGWVWQPGGWNSWNARPVLANAPANVKVPAAPLTGHQTVMVGLGLTAYPPAFATEAAHRLTIHPDSAGFGVPRGSVNHLDRVAKTMQRTSRPAVVSTVAPEAPFPAQAPFGREMSPAGVAPVGGSRRVPGHP